MEKKGTRKSGKGGTRNQVKRESFHWRSSLLFSFSYMRGFWFSSFLLFLFAWFLVMAGRADVDLMIGFPFHDVMTKLSS